MRDRLSKYYKNTTVGDLLSSIINSYSQVFFSKNRIFAVILFIVSFFDVYAGIAGLLAIIISNLFAWFLGTKRQNIIDGTYGFNALMVGLGIGIYYQPGIEFYILLLVVSLLTLLITISLEGVLYKYGLPFLSIPFLFGIWFVLIASRGYSALELSERGIYSLNDMFAIGGMSMVNLYQWFNDLPISEVIRIYFKSLSAILFQYHLFAGILIAIGLLIYSRISFLMSIIGFFVAYYFYLLIGANISELSYSYIGFNYILMSIAIGGYFIVPSRNTVLWVVLLTPVVAITLSSTSALFANFGISVYSLPFNMVVLLFLYVLKLRESKHEKIVSVTYQMHSPELNAYTSYNYMQRFGSAPVFSMKLPFWGTWIVTQAHNGEMTHKDLWRYAWDFEIFDENGRSFTNGGNRPEDYHCFNKPVLAPADGKVVAVEDNIQDNTIGEVNINKNWGNSIVIEHGPYFYSQLSHLKSESIKVKVGQYVSQGEIIGTVGNSGRSPYPHLHMQFQSSSEIGSPTIDYPFSTLLRVKNNVFEFESVCRPEKGDLTTNIEINDTLLGAFSFTLGTEMSFKVNRYGVETTEKWIAEVDIYNNRYIRCKTTGDKAWFNNTGDIFYFTYYEGKNRSLLFCFFLAAFKVPMTNNKDLIVKDNYPLNMYRGKLLLILQDFIIPFVRILKARFTLTFHQPKDSFNDDNIFISSTAEYGVGNRILKKNVYEILVNDDGISTIKVNGDNHLVAKRLLNETAD